MNAKKIAIILGVIILLGAIVGFTVNQSQKNVVTVQTGKVMKQDISSQVTASGEIRPQTYVNVGANAMGRIIRLYVKEGDKVKKDQLISKADYDGKKAAYEVAEAVHAQNQARVAQARATLDSAKSRVNQSRS